MRVDSGGDVADVGALDPLSRMKGSISAVRRRWYVVLLTLVVGAAAGWFSAPAGGTVNREGEPTAVTSYFRASHVLVADQPATDPLGTPLEGPLDLNRAAYLVSTGEVPNLVAEELGLPLDEVRESLLGLPREAVSSIEVQAFATNQSRAERMATSAAEHLDDVLADRAGVEALATSEELQRRVDQLGREIDALTSQIDAGAPDRTRLEVQRSAATEEYAGLLQQQSDLEGAPPPTSGFSTLQTARITRITKSDFDRARKTIRDGADYVTGTPTTVPADGSSGSAGPGVGASRSTRAGLGGVAGLGTGIGLILLLDRVDNRLRRRERVEAITGLTVVAEIPPLTRAQQESREVVAHRHPRSRTAETYRVLRSALLYASGHVLRAPTPAGSSHEDVADPDHPGAMVVMVTSPSPEEGKTTTVANLAAVLAEGGLRVLVVNCDFRRPLIRSYLLHEENAEPDQPRPAGSDGWWVADTEIDGVRLVTGIGEGDPEANPLGVAATQRKVVATARPLFDVILLDTAPFLTTNDASELFDVTDHLLLVVRAGSTRMEAARRAAEVLARFDVPVLGVVMNDSNESAAASYYYDTPASSRRANRAEPPPGRTAGI